MAKIAKEQRRAMRRRTQALRNRIADAAPPWVRTLIDYADMLFVDHGIFRLIYANRHRVSSQVWRSSQPAPGDIRAIAALGVRTIVNLRGERDCGGFRLQQRACQKYGLTLEELVIKSRAVPTRSQVHEAKALFARIDYPMLLHCKSGADRAGVVSALYLILHEGAPVEIAKEQLHARYGHFRQADTGVLDYMFDRYLADNARSPINFLDWVDTVCDPDALKRDFKASGWANALVNRLLRRE